jgi:hypothetical protein
MHALLCFSASHLRQVSPTPGAYDVQVYHHKSQALSLLQNELSSFSADSMKDYIFGTSTFLSNQTLSEFSSSPSSLSPNVEWIHLVLGTRAVLEPMWGQIEKSVFYAEVTYKSPEIPTNPTALDKFSLSDVAAHLPSTYTSHVVKLANLIDELFPERHYVLPPLERPALLNYRYSGQARQRIRDIFVWAVTLPDTFRSRVQENDPGVLKLLAWSNAAMRELYFVSRDIWWMENIAQYGVSDVLRFLQREGQ